MTATTEREQVRQLALEYIHEDQRKPRRTQARRFFDTLFRPMNLVFGLLT